jgi:hypothetical protein
VDFGASAAAPDVGRLSSPRRVPFADGTAILVIASPVDQHRSSPVRGRCDGPKDSADPVSGSESADRPISTEFNAGHDIRSAAKDGLGRCPTCL